MASPTYALHRIRRNVREDVTPPPEPPTKAFDEHRDTYEELLKETRILGGDLAIDALTDWIITQTADTNTLPTPAAVRSQARVICTEQGVAVPAVSPLRED